ncbi:MAG TPA: hypothetical protein VKA09_13570 [Nitrososphaeraceae archaeon]|nr:hypothetical protein [Nitrososphaeraceae archaeon]
MIQESHAIPFTRCLVEKIILSYLLPHDLITRNLGFMNQPELLNVATSRHLMKLIIVGDDGETFAEGSSSSKKIYDFISSKRYCANPVETSN